jgi:hypothetical protein
MKKFLALLAAVAFTAVFAVGCGGDDKSESGSPTTAAESGGSGGSESGGSGSGSSNTGNAEVDAYCNQVQELASSVEQAVQNKDTSNMDQLSQQAQDLAKDAAALAPALIEDPSLASKVQECSQQATQSLQDLSSGLAGGAAGNVDDMMPDNMDDMMPDTPGDN